MAFLVENNMPSAGNIRWSSLHIQYKGVNYTITDGYTNYIYVYWTPSSPTALVVTNTFPTLGVNDCLLFLNKSGIAIVVPTSNVISGDIIAPGTIVAANLAANTVTGDKIAAGTITAANIATGTISANLIAANAIGANSIAAGVITGDKLVVDAITAREIATATITANEIAANTITAAKIAAGTITATEIAAGTITAAKIAAGTITAAQIASGTITGDMINGGTITGALIKTSSTTNYMHLKEQTINVYNQGTLKLTMGYIDAGGFEYFPQLIMYNNEGEAKVVGAIMGSGALASGIDSIENDLDVFGNLWSSNFSTNGYISADGPVESSHVIGNGVGTDYYNGGIETRGNGASNTAPPLIGFHQPGLYAGAIKMTNGQEFDFRQQNGALANINALYIRGVQIIATDWLRSVGQNGWYNETYGGGIYMTDSSWVRVSHGRNFHCEAGIMGQDIYTSRLRAKDGGSNIYIGNDACRIDLTSNTFRLFTTWGGNPDTGITFDGNSFTYKINSTTKFNVSSSGTKTGGFIELDGMNVGLSPVDSPRVLHQDIIYDVMVEESGTVIFLDSLFAKTMDGYAVFPNNGKVIVSEKNENSFTVIGCTGMVDFNIIGNRRDMKHQYFDIQ